MCRHAGKSAEWAAVFVVCGGGARSEVIGHLFRPYILLTAVQYIGCLTCNVSAHYVCCDPNQSPSCLLCAAALLQGKLYVDSVVAVDATYDVPLGVAEGPGNSKEGGYAQVGGVLTETWHVQQPEVPQWNEGTHLR